jgi:predicted enzyme related to lactoylglutathione lyase
VKILMSTFGERVVGAVALRVRSGEVPQYAGIPNYRRSVWTDDARHGVRPHIRWRHRASSVEPGCTIGPAGARSSVPPVTAPAPPLSVPLVWAELITSDPSTAVDFYGAVLQWRALGNPGSTDLVVYLDQARIAGPICGIRPRTPTDPRPLGLEGPPPDRWSVRLAPPRPDLAADPGGDQLLRPRSPGPRIGRWAVPRALCFAELRTPDVAGARAWMERRLDASITEAADADGEPVLQLHSALDEQSVIAAIVEEPDPAQAGWALAVQVPDLAQIGEVVVERGGRIEPRPVPVGFAAEAAATLHDPGGARMILVEHGPAHGRRG